MRLQRCCSHGIYRGVELSGLRLKEIDAVWSKQCGVQGAVVVEGGLIEVEAREAVHVRAGCAW